MRRTYLSFCFALVLFISFLTSHAVLAATGPTFTLSISDHNQKPGDEISVTVKGDNFNDVYAYEVNLEFDNKLLKLKGAKAEQESGFSISPIVKGNKIQFAHTKVGKVAGDSGKISLCTFTFEPIDSGEAQFGLKDVKLVNSQLASSTLANSAIVSAHVDKVLTNEMNFKDILNHWAKEAILAAVKQGFVEGYPDQTFRPNNNVSRSEFVAMLIRALKIQPTGGSSLPFTDADQIPDWSKPFVSEAVKLGIVSGYEDNSFRSADPISRAELAVMIVKAFGLQVDWSAKASFADANDIPSWAVPHVAAAADAGFIQGRGNNLFAPNDKATRAEVVNLILSMLKHKGL
ncbi:S-layer homology domain-containing protein [Paenibacillus sp. N3.4]|uniref:S-layer homology domain-containing protein n=1 Tax=Paenibacillus sp. N3.4 TaxID=2603222 RepID=UPI0011CA08CF|nr:S-layer homology domain-containing protein [Paenibacillus sp. N3.4]TXK83828.1 hypothetical protein FU659_12135 [Paenibacillus sp. N3.4]